VSSDTTTTQRICIIGGGAAGVGLAWSLAKASQLGLNRTPYDITLVHDGPTVGGHSISQPVTLGGQAVRIDCGVQMIAPTMYPLTLSMLALPEFKTIDLATVDLKIACAFPGTSPGTVQYWGNFGNYRNTPLGQSGMPDAQVFQNLLAAKFSVGYGIELAETVHTMINENARLFTNGDPSHFITYFLDAYMSIMNGYGAALLDQLLVGDLAPLFDLGYASFTRNVTGYGRFKDGADSWVQQMWTLAGQQLGPTAIRGVFGSSVTALYPSPSGPTVVWQNVATGQSSGPRPFDVVVSTLDMLSNSKILNNSNNGLWSTVFEPAIGTLKNDHETTVWPLLPGFCTLHQDPSVLAPTAMPPQEVLQFNTLPGVKNGGPGFNLLRSNSTYISSNLLGIPGVAPADDWYVTMYGFVPQPNDRPKKSIWSGAWTHGMWLPTFMVHEKIKFHRAQSKSPYHTPHFDQSQTNIFFAGNNLIMDSEEGALASGLAITKYAFGVDPITLLTPPGGGTSSTLDKARIEFDVMFDVLMFPSLLEEALASLRGALKWFLKHWIPVWGPGPGSSHH
jgi:NAD(P)-binding Rossmann-like domain